MKWDKRTIAYHEAAHVAAIVFTGNEMEIGDVSIRANSYSRGHVARADTGDGDDRLEDWAPHLQRKIGMRRLLHYLAGHAAAARIADPPDRRPLLDQHREEWDWEGTDIFRALYDAEVMARPGMPARRVLALAEKWTVEMLALPDVWRCVETLAGMLLDRGTIEDRDEIMSVCDGILCAGLNLPKWKRRLLPTTAEVEAMLTKEDKARWRKLAAKV